MSRILPMFIAALVAGGIGILIGHGSGGDGALEAANESAAETTRIESELEQIRAENEGLAAKNTQAAEENGELRRSIATLEARIQELETPPEETPAPAVAISGEEGRLPVSFGGYEDLDFLMNADWETMAKAMTEMRGDLATLMLAIQNGEQPDMEMVIEIQKKNQKLVGFALEANGKLPTHATGNGEFTHPIATTNLMSRALDDLADPLTPTQRGQIESFGEDFEAEWDSINSAYGDETLTLQKLMDEVEMKQSFMDHVESSLSQTQRNALFEPATRNMAQFDLWSPALMFSGRGNPMIATSEANLREQMIARAAKATGLGADELGAHPEIFDEWVNDVRGILDPVAQQKAGFYNLQQGVVAGRAQARAMEAMVSRFSLTEDARLRLLESGNFFVPRMVKSDD